MKSLETKSIGYGLEEVHAISNWTESNPGYRTENWTGEIANGERNLKRKTQFDNNAKMSKTDVYKFVLLM